VTVASWWPVAAVSLPLVGALLSLAWLRLPEGWRPSPMVALTVVTAAIALGFLPVVLAGITLETWLVRLTSDLWLHLRIDAAGASYGATVATLWVLAVVYSLGHMRGAARRARFYGVLTACLGCALGVAYAGNLLTFLVFYELLSLLTYALIVHDQTAAAYAAGAKYIVYVLIGGSLVLAGLLLTYSLAGDLTFARGGLLHEAMPATALAAAFWCFIAGFGVKAALLPLHGWVPDAHPAAPAPFSALLSGVLVAAGAFGIMRVLFEVFGVELLARSGFAPWLGLVAAATVLAGGLLAFGQDELKRRLAFSTVSQMAYVVLALSLLGPTATVGALVHVTHHAFMKGALFFCAGLFTRTTGRRRVSALGGVARRMPLTAAAFTIASFGLLGTPPLAGFVSKWWLGSGMLEAGAPQVLIVLLGGALLAAGYLLPVAFTLYFGAPSATVEGDVVVPLAGPEAPLTMLAPTLLCAGLALLLGLAAGAPGLPTAVARQAAAAFFGGS
jgi:multicomponent Na+:H+ antiporter subunit D